MSITSQQCGASQVSCEIVNNTFLSLDGFEPMRQHMEANHESNAAKHFAAELARIADREIKHAFEQTKAEIEDDRVNNPRIPLGFVIPDNLKDAEREIVMLRTRLELAHTFLAKLGIDV